MNIGFIGLGIMGSPMALNILAKSNSQLCVYDLDITKIEEIVAFGGLAAASPAELVEKSDVIITMVPTSKNVEDLYNLLLEQDIKNRIFIDMSTIEPAVSIKTAEKVREKKGEMLDAPVVKSKAAAETGELGIYVGGDSEIFEKVKPVLEYMGKNIIYMGKNGNGLIMKICHNILVGMIQNGVNEVLSLAESLGIDYEKFVTAISYGGGQNFYLDSKWGVISGRNFEPAFSVKNMNKDVNLACELMKSRDLDLPGFQLVKEVYTKAMENGLENLDFSASFKIVKNEI